MNWTVPSTGYERLCPKVEGQGMWSTIFDYCKLRREVYKCYLPGGNPFCLDFWSHVMLREIFCFEGNLLGREVHFIIVTHDSNHDYFKINLS
jgi:hypothetical protein